MISLVIINDNSNEYVKNLVDSIDKNSVVDEIIIISSNCLKPELPEILDVAIRHEVLNFQTKSMPLLYNIGIDLSKNDYILFVHADIVFLDQFFKKLEKDIFNENPDLVFFNIKTYEFQTFGFNNMYHDINTNQIYITELWENTPPNANDILYISSSCFLVKKSILHNCKFDNQYHYSYYDAEIFYNLYQNKIVVRHYSHISYMHYFIELHDIVKNKNNDIRLFHFKNAYILRELEIQNELNILKKELLDKQSKLEQIEKSKLYRIYKKLK